MMIYSPADVARLLNIKEPTLRKYSLLLEKVGYEFKRNAQGQRWYSDKDITVFRKFIALKYNADMNLESSADAAFLWSTGTNIAEPQPVTRDAIERNEDEILKSLDEMKAAIRQQGEQIEALTSIIKQQQAVIDDTQPQQAAPAIETAEQPKQQKRTKKSFLQRLFK